jgi:plastocyanin
VAGRACRFYRLVFFLAGLFALHPALLGSVSVQAQASGATIVGQVVFHGTVPPVPPRPVTRNPEFCGRTVSVQPLLVDPSTHGVRDVVVSAEGPSAGPVSRPIEDQIIARKCTFAPKVMAAQVGEAVEFLNEDPVMHNTNMTLNGRTVMNEALVADGNPVEKDLTRPGLHRIVCNAHKFMTGHLLVFEHPYFAVTDETGRFRITGLPPGLRGVTLWHESLGTLKKEVTVPSSGEVRVTFEFP